MNTQALIAAMQAAGLGVTLSDHTQSAYDALHPALDAFDVVVHLNGNTTTTIDHIPTSSVAKLVNYVQNLGGGIVTSENTEAQISIPFLGLTALMETLMLLDRQAGAPPAFGEMTLTAVPGQEEHPLLRGLSSPFSFSGGRMRALVREYATDPATVVLRDEVGLDAAAVRDFGTGRVVSFHHTGNFHAIGTLSDTLLDPNVQRLYINAVLWADRRAPVAVSIEKEESGTAGAAGAPFIVSFSEGVLGVNATDFQVQASPGLSYSPALTIAPISDRQYRVTVGGLNGNGTLGLDLLDDDSIVDMSVSGNRLGGDGTANGGVTGPFYLVDAVLPGITSFTVTPEVIPLGDRAQFTLHFSEPMNTAYAPAVRIITDENSVITASPSIPPPDGRVHAGLVALYSFDEGAGDTVHDRSGAGTALDLAIASAANVSWVEGGISLDTPTILLSTSPASKIFDACTASNEITLEAWIRPLNNTQTGPARIATLSAGLNARDVTLEQNGALYDARLRTTANSSNGDPALDSAAVASDGVLQHVVFTRTAAGDAALYVDNAVSAAAAFAGDFSTWAGNYKFSVGNELSQNRPWKGTIYLVAVYSRALSIAEVAQNFGAGPATALPGDGEWLNSTTYAVTMDRAVVPSDQGGAVVQVSQARDLVGNAMLPNSSNKVGIIASTLQIESEPDALYARGVGEPFQFTVSVSGAIGGILYQWKKDNGGQDIVNVGSNAPVLTFTALDATDAGDYFCEISDTQGSIQTRASHLQVLGPLPMSSWAALAAAAGLAGAAGGVLRRPLRRKLN